MPYYHYREIKTPLKLIGIRLMRDDEGNIWIKVRKSSRRMLKRG